MGNRFWYFVVTLIVVIGNALPLDVKAADDLEEARSARLGGTAAQIQERFGDPDWTDVSLVGYNAIDLAGVPTILVVYYDPDQVVNKLSLVYLEQPAQFEAASALFDTVKEVIPTDSTCTESTKSTGLGPEMHRCKAPSLKGLYSSDELASFGVKGDDSYFNYSVNPVEDDYYEIVVQFGTDSFAPTPTPVPTEAPLPTPTPSLETKYPPVADVRDLAIGRGYTIGDPLSLSGTVFNILVEGDFATIQIDVSAPDGSTEPVIMGYSGDSTGIYEGTWVTVYGTYMGPYCFTNALGGQVCQPLIDAEILLH